jgi:hypothetical protein
VSIKDRQFALYILAIAFITVQGLVSVVERAQDLIFLLTVKAYIFVYWHRIFIIPKIASVVYLTMAYRNTSRGVLLILGCST